MQQSMRTFEILFFKSRLFHEGILEFGTIPSRVRGDYGGENVLVADFMIENRGEDRGSFLTGSSHFNTRCERQWRDLRKNVNAK
jgi:hypothetical protein